MKVAIVFSIACLLSACALFKKTTRASAEAKEELNRQAEASKLAVKTRQKETNVYTYWPDGSLYQWKNQTEQLDEAKYGRLTIDENVTVKKEGTQVESVPSLKFSNIVFILLVVAFIMFALYVYQKRIN